jgi:hypothetical protein
LPAPLVASSAITSPAMIATPTSARTQRADIALY